MTVWVGIIFVKCAKLEKNHIFCSLTNKKFELGYSKLRDIRKNNPVVRN